MALTQINSNGITDGSIVNADIGSSAAIAGSKLADDSIAEGKLDIHNAPSDGKFLKYDGTNGMEWGDVPAGVGGSNGVDFNDSVKARFGTGNDLEIYHNGSHSYIADEGSGELIISGNRIQLMDAARNEKAIDFVQNGAVDIYYDGSRKLQTKSNGVRVTGEVHSDSLDVDGDADIAGTVRINRLVVDDDGSDSPTLSVRGDDGNPWGFVLGNDTYSSNADHGFKIYQDNSGNIHNQIRGNGNFENWYLSTNDGSTNNTVIHVDTNRAVHLTHAGNTKLSTTSSGVSITGTLSGNGSGLTNTGGLKSIQVFASVGTATWTKPSGINTIKVYVTAGGGGGGGTDNDDMAGGGGAGGTAIEIIDVSSVSSVTVTVGGGGTGASNSQNSNSYGGTSSFGSYCSATGGNRYGGNWAIAGAGGSATGGSYNIDGGDGQGGLIDNTGSHQAAGTGGASFWGGGGRGATRSSTTNHQNGRAWGSGGGGGANGSTSRNGKQGIVVVEEYA